MTYQTLDISIAGTLATVTLNRPDVRNAFNETDDLRIDAGLR